MRISDFDYELPPDLIAGEPIRPRDASRMMILDRRTGQYADSAFRNLPKLLRVSDVLVLNDTRVIRARVHGRLARGEGRKVEVLFAAPSGPAGATDVWEVMCRPGKHIRPGDRVVFDGAEAVFGEARPCGLRMLYWRSAEPIEIFLERQGHVPLPPYINRPDSDADAQEYQTIYASATGAIAAPTAGLHFTEAMLGALQGRGIEILRITLHVGVGTFLPVRGQDPREHVLKPERFQISEDAARRLNVARSAGRRIIAVGTTTTRALEHLAHRDRGFVSGSGEADLFILPGHQFRAVDGILTNFHLPRSTLLMLVAAFASPSAILNAYRHAARRGYRFYSYGDCMLII